MNGVYCYKMFIRHNVIEAVIGAIVLVIAGYFLVYAYTSSQGGQIKGYALEARFDRIDGLNVGCDVKVSGVKVGNVQSVTIDPETYLAKVVLSVRDDVKVPNDTVAEIVSESLLGGKYIALVPGGSDTYLTAGQSLSHTQSSISFESLIGKYLFSSGDKGADDKKKDGVSGKSEKSPSPN